MTDQCKFFMDISKSESLTKMYLKSEKEDGYFRDGCVFSPEINICDTRAITASYRNNVLLSYSLNNYAPYEGYKVAFIGTEGRIEQDVIENAYISGHEDKPERQVPKDNIRLEVYPQFEESYKVEVETASKGHGGGDIRLLEDIFLEDTNSDPLNRKAGGIDGAMSILTGIAARKSIELGRAINIDELVSNLNY